ncbi:NAD(P)H-binding protein [Dyadobacter sp. CY345]|uniref:NAD(P)-dependent oxidoreductase n=1 Tax=Dyadobacter sp. CY345 TaxID=2909335 RepID=UPI001F3644F2|nr:NAD(P)H-binding protein [Dyadobacter sp. CY345]MCF2447583.1 NAD(P)H-binding protein [Dyadobacter sp. CY345]
MNSYKKIAVLGGGGRTGKYLVNHLLSRGYHLKILLRKIPENFETSNEEFGENLTNPLVEIVTGDAIVLENIRQLLSGCQAVISTIGQRPGEPMVASTATEHVLRAMQEFGIQRYILLAGVNVNTPFDKKSEKTMAATEWMKQSFPEIHADREKAYHLLSQSELDWTLVRLPLIEYTVTSFAVDSSIEDCAGTKISTADIAAFLEQQLHDKRYIRKAPFLYNVD